VKRLLLLAACAGAVVLAAATAAPASAAIACPPPPCVPSTQTVCPLESGAIVYCGCPIAVTGTTLPVLDLGCADLAVTERVDRATATVGDRLTYTVDVRNAGPDPTSAVTLADALPPGLELVSASGPAGACSAGAQVTCDLGALGAGEAASATLVARAAQAGELANVVTASSTTGDPDLSNDQATATTHVDPAAAPPPRPPSAPAFITSWCSPSGDVCLGRVRGRGPLRLGLTLAARYFKRYELCVTAPDGTSACRRFRVHRESSGRWGSTVRWRRRFPDRGRGTYKATWSTRSGPIGPPISFCKGSC
jgi:uncharacterized repeat protein (TIGR01451 family)